MRIKGILETFTDYKNISMIILSEKCDFKCENEGLCPRGSCQNSSLSKSPTFEIKNENIVKQYLNNKLVRSIVIGGLEPMLQFDEIIDFIHEFRKYTLDDVVIFTGYNKYEILDKIDELKKYKNIIIKYGRFNSQLESKFDEVLGIKLASSNQYAEKIS